MRINNIKCLIFKLGKFRKYMEEKKFSGQI